MFLETGDLEAVPIILAQALAKEGGEWWIDLHLLDGTVRGSYLLEADWDELRIQDESGDEPWGETHQWNDVLRVVIP